MIAFEEYANSTVFKYLRKPGPEYFEKNKYCLHLQYDMSKYGVCIKTFALENF